MKAMACIDNDDELWRRWLTCRWVGSFESGHCSEKEFASGVVDDWGLSITPNAFLDSFRSWPRGPFPGAAELVASVRNTVPTGCLSNTNARHWHDQFQQWKMLDDFDFRFLSFELGRVKPDREIFDLVADSIGTQRDRLLFLDDNILNILNIEAAEAAGFVARRVQGVEQARDALVANGVRL